MTAPRRGKKWGATNYTAPVGFVSAGIQQVRGSPQAAALAAFASARFAFLYCIRPAKRRTMQKPTRVGAMMIQAKAPVASELEIREEETPATRIVTMMKAPLGWVWGLREARSRSRKAAVTRPKGRSLVLEVVSMIT